ncbi:hypothetical protein A2962_04720 [Candidatus Woesebacteria bacterium RIFCSPLOWO2_01_FULL_39_61]|nr:MAG: hypothetical protein A2692_01040 [Candidatus Woesebacteria bacterium RIFCSPHIGHO2_01_FULL_39_95]OGM68640.1 MAG: hypothetical protein A2962_04720 [Candidatus Woesebacteria bacterium RIFCSPLOWO2_01_FULL_39_61]OGM73982.1 MAG: hypothetical protein A3H19_00640 [Candidatus Woesebacteria bacterium RIFCSPLOWO2_12_FULL_39_9]
MKMSLFRKILTPNIMVLLGPISVLLGVIILFVIILNNGYSQIKTQLSTLKTTRNSENQLQTKLDKLKDIPPGILDNSSDVIVVLPYKNPGILIISQMRLYANNNSLSLSKIELKNASKTNDQLAKMQLSGEFDIPNFLSAVNFLKNMISSAPISTLDELTIKLSQAGALEGELKTSAYWADLPTQLPPLNEPFRELTKEEQDLLTKVANFSQPEFTTLPPTTPGQRENPFK